MLALQPTLLGGEALDVIHDLVKGVAELVIDVVNLDPGEFFEDLGDIAEDTIVCDGAATPLSFTEFLVLQVGSGVAETLFDDCKASEPLEPDVLAKLENYFHSDLSSVRIHKDCDFAVERAAITFGENIYFKPGAYAPTCAGPESCDCKGGFDTVHFAVLAHELVHVLQYRRRGLQDFTCKYFLECGIGSVVDLDCPFEQQAFIYQALVLEDVKRDGDGIFTCPLGGVRRRGARSTMRSTSTNTRAPRRSRSAVSTSAPPTHPITARRTTTAPTSPTAIKRTATETASAMPADTCDSDLETRRGSRPRLRRR